ncbi:MAG: argininosuccinate lyase, partial [Firmicutes bacterium]|nr:argininosuccinate lyase [Bacillota bacterium]
LQAAQPVLLAHHWLAYANMLQRDWQRLTEWLQHVDISPLGAGALSGTPYPTDPRRSAELLGFSAVYANSMDAVSDRDFLLEFLFWASAVMVHLSRLAEEMVLWSSYEFGFVTMSDAYSTGSSIMPQKRNPDVAEILRGKSGRVFGHLSGLLTVMKGLPLAYHSDMQEDKEAVFDVVDTMEKVLAVTTGMMASVKVNRNRIASRLGKDYTAATDIADKLVEQGLPFRSAHHLVGKLVADLERDQLGFDQATAAYLKEHAPEISEAWLKELTPAALVARRQQPFATAPQSVQAALKSWQQWFSSHPTDDAR